MTRGNTSLVPVLYQSARDLEYYQVYIYLIPASIPDHSCMISTKTQSWTQYQDKAGKKVSKVPNIRTRLVRKFPKYPILGLCWYEHFKKYTKPGPG
jgi:hypothetical protein